MRLQNPPPAGTGRRADLKLQGEKVLPRPGPIRNPISGELRRFIVELRKCRTVFESDDLASIRLAVLGASLVCDDFLEICNQHDLAVGAPILGKAAHHGG